MKITPLGKAILVLFGLAIIYSGFRNFGTDISTYDSRSAIKGLTKVEEPILLAWSQADTPNFIAQGEKLKDMLCSAGHCPRISVLTKPSSPASVFDLDGASADLHERLRQLIGQIDAAMHANLGPRSSPPATTDSITTSLPTLGTQRSGSP